MDLYNIVFEKCYIQIPFISSKNVLTSRLIHSIPPNPTPPQPHPPQTPSKWTEYDDVPVVGNPFDEFLSYRLQNPIWDPHTFDIPTTPGSAEKVAGEDPAPYSPPALMPKLYTTPPLMCEPYICRHPSNTKLPYNHI